MRTYYLDSNALSNCLGRPHLQGWTKDGSALLRSKVAEGILGGCTAVLGSQYHLEEASRIPSFGAEDARQRFLDFFWNSVKWLLVIPTDELAIAEARSGGRLEGNEPFDSAKRLMTIKQLCRSKASLDRLAGGVEQFVKDFGAQQSARKKELIEKLKAKNVRPSKTTKKWWENADAQVEDWVTDYMTNSAELLGLPADKTQWPPPRAMQTAWAMHSCLMARVVLNVGESWEVDDGDLHDAHHYAAACYADVFVVQDKGSRETVSLIPNTPVEVLTFNEFAAELGVQPH